MSLRRDIASDQQIQGPTSLAAYASREELVLMISYLLDCWNRQNIVLAAYEPLIRGYGHQYAGPFVHETLPGDTWDKNFPDPNTLLSLPGGTEYPLDIVDDITSRMSQASLSYQEPILSNNCSTPISCGASARCSPNTTFKNSAVQHSFPRTSPPNSAASQATASDSALWEAYWDAGPCNSSSTLYGTLATPTTPVSEPNVAPPFPFLPPTSFHLEHMEQTPYRGTQRVGSISAGPIIFGDEDGVLLSNLDSIVDGGTLAFSASASIGLKASMRFEVRICTYISLDMPLTCFP